MKTREGWLKNEEGDSHSGLPLDALLTSSFKMIAELKQPILVEEMLTSMNNAKTTAKHSKNMSPEQEEKPNALQSHIKKKDGNTMIEDSKIERQVSVLNAFAVTASSFTPSEENETKEKDTRIATDVDATGYDTDQDAGEMNNISVSEAEISQEIVALMELNQRFLTEQQKLQEQRENSE